MTPWGLYLHVPWCRIRCPYCPFVIAPDGPHTPWASYVQRLLDHHQALRPRFSGPPTTVYFGGGTPSRLPRAHRRQLLSHLEIGRPEEVTLEANPEDVTDALLDDLLDEGIHRISLGVQTLHPDHARTLGRAHTPADARRALDQVRAAGLRSWSVDLMFGLPGQTVEDVRRDLDELLRWEPPHVSLYGLTIEPGTPFERAVRRGKLTPADDDLQAEMYEVIVELLREAGLRRYEVSNFCRPGHAAQHNRGYWRHQPYLGLGPGAHSLTPDGWRLVAPEPVDRWLASPTPTAQAERPTPERVATDHLIAGMRTPEGVDLARLRRETGWTPDPGSLERLRDGGLIQLQNHQVQPSERGMMLADGVTSALVEALVPVEADGPTR